MFVAVAGEEQGLVGSAHLAKVAREQGWQLLGVLNNDIVGGNTTPGETLQLTQNAQPALMAVSLAALRALESEAGFSVGRDAAFVAGHSLGEYSALAAAGSLSITDTARLLRTRGLAMQKAVPVSVGAMAALLGLDYEAAVAVASDVAGRGIGRALVDAATAQLVADGADGVKVVAGADNAAAVGLYEACGYRVADHIEVHGGTTSVVLVPGAAATGSMGVARPLAPVCTNTPHRVAGPVAGE